MPRANAYSERWNPRGDKPGVPRPHRKHVNLPKYEPEWLRVRLRWFDEESGLNKYTERDSHDGKGNSFRRPGSQKR